ncbi:MAG: hydroxymethylbilane synthase [Fusobacteriaceae bacterium]|nr:hydroxymethylbilane synthase [Fusobacteriaceae bacterium]
MKKLIIGTRGSNLALAQAEHIKSRLEKMGLEIELKIIKTSGDINQSTFNEIPLKKLFVKEIEEELLANKIDLAVHSMKDMPYDEVEGLIMGAYPEREDPRDALIVHNEIKIIGTGSERRRVQLEALYENIEVRPIRGNVDTRILKLHNGDYDAIVLAAAGLNRLGLDNMISRYFEVEEMVPSPCQGVLGIQCREDDEFVRRILDLIDNKELRKVVELERLFGKIHNGGCKSPIGAYAEIDFDIASVWTMKLINGKIIKRKITGKTGDLEFFEKEFRLI